MGNPFDELVLFTTIRARLILFSLQRLDVGSCQMSFKSGYQVRRGQREGGRLRLTIPMPSRWGCYA